MSNDANVNVSLTATDTSLSSGINKAVGTVQGGVGEMQQALSVAGGSISEFAIGAASALAAGFSIEKIVSFGEASVELGDKINKMSQQIGVGAEALSALQSQAALADVGFDQFGAAMTRLARSSTEAAAGSKTQAAAYDALGVSVKNAVTGQVRPAIDIIEDVAKKLSGMQDGVVKTTLAMDVMGRGGAQLLPLMNELGTKGFEEVKKQAEAYNQVIGPDQAKASEELHDNMLKSQMVVSGFANAVMQQLLPGLVKVSETMAEAAKSNDKYAASATPVATAIKYLIVGFADATATVLGLKEVLVGLIDTVGGVGDVFNGFAKGLLDDFTAIGEAMRGNLGAAKTAFAQAGTDLADGWTKGLTRIENAWTGMDAKIQGHLDTAKHVFDAMLGEFSNVSGGAETTAKSIGKIPGAADDAAERASKLTHELQAWAMFMDTLNGKVGTIFEQSMAAFSRSVNEADARIGDMLGNGLSLADAIDMDAQATDAATAAMWRSIAADVAKNDLADDMIQHLADENAKLAAVTTATQAQAMVQEAANKALLTNRDLYGRQYATVQQATAAIKEQTPALEANVQAGLDLNQALKANQQVTRDWVNIWQQAGDQIASTFSKILVEGGSLMDGLKSMAQQTVEAIIQYFLKLAVINPILNAVFGTAVSGGAGLLPTLAGAAITGASGSSGSSFAGLDPSLLLSSGTTMGKGMGGGFMDTVSHLWSGGGASSGIFGSYSGAGDFGPGTFTPSGLTTGLGIAGGVYAGYNRYQEAGGGLGGLAGGAAYGYGTYAASVGGAALASGAGLGGAALAMGPIGWAALALVAVDMISGGKLFGTKGKFNFGEQATTVGPTGATVTAGYDMKGQKALFGGSTHSWTSLDVDPAAQAAADAFFKALSNGTEAFAKSFGVTAGDIIGGQFIQKFDKKGNPTSSSSTVNGVTYNEDAAHFQTRLGAENMLAVLDQLSKGISSAVDQYRVDADQLMAVTQALAQGETMMQAGTKFLALGADQSLTSLLALAQGMQGMGETIDQTLQRIEQAQGQYDQFVGQFKPAATYTSDFQAAIANIGTQMAANIKQANALAVAAGAEHASTQDLINIHNYAAAQFAQAVAALKTSTANIAQSLGYAPSTNLDDINSQIAALESAQSAMNNLGASATNFAQQATDAANLLLGDLSPYNDQQKLQMALQGQMQGTVTPTQVLQIAQRLMGSGSDYKALFNQVMAIGDRTQHGSTSTGSHSSFSSADAAHLADLKKQRDEIEASQRHADALQLAQNIADEVSATGETVQQALTEAGITDITPFLKDLGIANSDDFDKFIEGLEKNTDSAGDNTADLAARVDDTNAILNLILVAVGGTPVTTSSLDLNTEALNQNTAATRSFGHSQRGDGDSGIPGSRSTRTAPDFSRTR